MCATETKQQSVRSSIPPWLHKFDFWLRQMHTIALQYSLWAQRIISDSGSNRLEF